MYGNAGVYVSLKVVEGYSVAYMILIWMHCDTQCSSLGSLVFTHLGSIQEIKMQLMYITIYYYYIFLLLQYHA